MIVKKLDLIVTAEVDVEVIKTNRRYVTLKLDGEEITLREKDRVPITIDINRTESR